MHYTTRVIWYSEIGDCACVIFIEIVFLPWRRTEKLHCIFTVFTEQHKSYTVYLLYSLNNIKVTLYIYCIH
jgi:hypothetical protein